MRKALNIIIPILVCFLVGLSASYFQADAIKNWYPTLIKPVVTPPNIVFPIAWSIIYVCMGLSIGLLINSTIERRRFSSKHSSSSCFQFHLEHQLLLYPEPAYRIYQYPVARHLRYQLHIEELSGKQNQLNTFHTLRNMVVVCNLFEWVYINV